MVRSQGVCGSILVVDDNRDIADFLVSALKRFGHRAHPAYDGEEALAEIAENDFDIVITDLTMPSIDGIGVLKAAEKKKRRPTVLMISGQTSLQAAAAAIRMGAYDFIPKPMHIYKLNEIIQRAMRRQHLVSRIGSQKTMAAALSMSLPVWLVLGMVLGIGF